MVRQNFAVEVQNRGRRTQRICFSRSDILFFFNSYILLFVPELFQHCSGFCFTTVPLIIAELVIFFVIANSYRC